MRKEIYPDSASSSDVVEFKYNRQSQRKEITDQLGTVRAIDYDKLGRQTHERVTNLASGEEATVPAERIARI